MQTPFPPHVDPAVIGLLANLGIETVEQFLGVAQVAAPELRAFLGVEPDEIAASFGAALEAIPEATRALVAEAPCSLGVLVEQIPHLGIAPTFSPLSVAAPLGPQSVNLIPHMPAIRDQGNRGTCVAHAALACYEHTLGAAQDLAEQFLYWDCKQHDGVPNQEGTWLGVAMPLLVRDGCCPEATWPYNPHPVVGNESQAPPPGGAQLAALAFRPPSIKPLSATSVRDIRAELFNNRCVAFSIPVFNSWYQNLAVRLTGDITMPIPGEVRVGGHAMCIVGMNDQPASPEIGGGRFTIRNSWGTSWASNSSTGVAGYGTLPYAYIAKFGLEAYSVG